MWQNWVNAVLGVWTIAVPFIGFTADTMTWVLAVTGIVIAVLAVWGAGGETVRESAMEHEQRLRHQ